MKKHLCLALGLLFLSPPASALDIGVGVKAGTIGAGVDLSFALTKTINARLSLTDVSQDFDETIEIQDANNSATIDSTLDLGFGATGLLIDWYIFDGTFHLTAGMIRNDSKVDLEGTITDATVVFGGTTYDVSTDFTDPSMSGKIAMGEDFEPYIGIGWGRKASRDPGLSLSVELGIMLTNPDVDFTAPTASNPANQPALDADVQSAEDAAEEDLSVLEAWPILTVGINYAF